MGRWDGTTPEQRRAQLRIANDERSRQARETRIAELIEKWPPLRPDQIERLRLLLNPDLALYAYTPPAAPAAPAADSA